MSKVPSLAFIKDRTAVGQRHAAENWETSVCTNLKSSAAYGYKSASLTLPTEDFLQDIVVKTIQGLKDAGYNVSQKDLTLSVSWE